MKVRMLMERPRVRSERFPGPDTKRRVGVERTPASVSRHPGGFIE